MLYTQQCIKRHLNIELTLRKKQNIYMMATTAYSKIYTIANWLLEGFDKSLIRKKERLLNIIQRELERSETRVTKEYPRAVGTCN